MCQRATTTPRCAKFAALILFCCSLFLSHESAFAIKSPSSLSFVKIHNNNNNNNKHSNNTIMAGKKNKSSAAEAAPPSSSALGELKDTIKTQAAEIDRLKKELASSSSKGGTIAKKVPSGGHAHGAPSSADNEDILDYKTKSSYAIAYERVWWLAVFLFSLSFTAVIMNGFEHTLSKQIELAYFVPLMAGHGGNTGGQVVGTVLSALSAGVITRKDAFRVITKEALSGLIMGVILGAMIGPISHYVMGISVHVSAVVSITFPLLSTIASFLGSSLPFACVGMGLDPAVIAAPAMTSLVDVTGLLCYFLIANKVFMLFGLEL